MSAMDKMIAQMIGVNPAELGQMVTDFQAAVNAIGSQVNRIEEKLDAVLAERIEENVNGTTLIGNGDSVGDSDKPTRRRAGRGSGSAGGSGAE